MKKQLIYRPWVIVISLLVAGLSYTSCEDYDELPPQSDTNYSNKVYKVASPTVMDEEDIELYNAIKAEYEAGTKS